MGRKSVIFNYNNNTGIPGVGARIRRVYISQTAVCSCPRLPNNLVQQPLCLLLQCSNLRSDFRQWAQRLQLKKVAGDAYLVADLDAVRNVPNIGGIGQNLAPEEGHNPTLSARGVCSVSVHHGGLAIDGAENRPRKGSAAVPFSCGSRQVPAGHFFPLGQRGPAKGASSACSST